MLTACGGSAAKVRPELPRAPDPVVETRTVREPWCPSEVTADVPARPAVPAGAVIEGNEAGLGYVGDLGAYAALLRQRLLDAREVCPK